MDSTILVSDMIGAGEDLISKLREGHFALRDAFWAFDVEDDDWYLYLVNPHVDRDGSRPYVRLALDTARSLESWRDRSLMDIRVLGERAPLAKAIGSYIDRFATRPNGPLTRVSGLCSEGVFVKEAWIYPR